MTWNRTAVRTAACAAVAWAINSGCSTDFGNAGEFLACDEKGQCAAGYTCAKTALGSVCMSKAQFRERCGKPELCNGADDNCNGQVDEGFDELGAACSVGVGACAVSGYVICAADGSETMCSTTASAPTDETCNGLDDDCDGATDEDIADIVTGSDTGECQSHIERCVDGAMTVLPGAVEPTDERCDGLDNDCDGDTDEDLADVITGIDEGECELHIESCVNGVPTIIQDGIASTDETCNALDDDCDGATDDGVGPMVSGSAVGACKPTIAECVNGAPLVTFVGVDPVGESCDGLDNNCDGATDETFSDLGWSCAVGLGECVASGMYVCGDDGTGTVCAATAGDPSAELCDNLDNNCDGTTDESFVELGSACSVGVGQCRAEGVRVCRPDGFGTRCGANPLEPTDETCDGLDNDCDGEIDDGLGDGCCIPGTSRDCGTDLGACTVGVRTCLPERSWGACSGQAPINETCNGFDDDCDGEADEGLVGCCGAVGGTISCSMNRGACIAGVQTCGSDGSWSTCSGVLPTLDRCNGLDDDCDGEADEDFPDLGESCDVGRGVCAASGVKVCTVDGLGMTCGATAGTPSNETCNMLDDDCDGEADDGLVEFSGTNIGECQQGIHRCVNGEFIPVQDEVVPADETCNGRDDDCDGIADDEAPNCCTPGDVRTCGIGRGVCTIGSQTCGGDRAWSACSGVVPSPEQCNGRDDDCDGTTDNPWHLQLGSACAIGTGNCSRLGVYRCAVDGSAATCDATPGTPGIESCNGLDDDCDGAVDEAADVPPVTEGSSVGRCRPLVLACIGGEMIEVQPAIGPSPETCNGLDDDCSGAADDGVVSVECYEGPIGSDGVGVCREGATSCISGNTRCIGQTLPSAERCNGLDDDCDGVTDGSVDVLTGLSVALAQPCYSGPHGTAGVGECVAGTTTCVGGVWGGCSEEVLPTTESCGDVPDSDCDGRVDGVTFLEDFEDNCAMSEATITSDVPLECVPTPVDSVDPSRTPSGQRSLRVALTYTDRNLETAISWPIDKCSESAIGSVRMQLQEPMIPSSGVLTHPIFTNQRSRLFLFSGGDGARMMIEEDVNGTQVLIPITFAPGTWHEIGWESVGARIQYRVDGVTIYDEETASVSLGFYLRAVVDSAVGAHVDILFDDVTFASP